MKKSNEFMRNVIVNPNVSDEVKTQLINFCKRQMELSSFDSAICVTGIVAAMGLYVRLFKTTRYTYYTIPKKVRTTDTTKKTDT